MPQDGKYSEKIDSFYGGISDDVRIQSLEQCAISQGFDIFTNPKRLTPYQAMEDDQTKSYQIRLFAYANSTLWAYGRKGGSATGEPKVYQKDTNDALASAWKAANSGEHSSTWLGQSEMFIEYHFRLYGNGSGVVWAWGSVGPSGTFTDTAYTTGSSPSCQALVTSDDKLLVYANSTVHMKNGQGSGVTDLWSEALDLPTYRLITDSCEYGDLVAIAVHPSGGFPSQLGSKVYLWDKVNEDPSQTIDWGGDHLFILDNLDGILVGASIVNYGEEGEIRNKLIIRQWQGGTKATVVFELEGDLGESMFIGPNYAKVRDASTLSFPIRITKDGTSYYMMGTIGRKNGKYPFSFTLTRPVTADGSVPTSIDGAFKMSDTYWFTHDNDGSTTRTNDSGDYMDATYVTQILTGESKVADVHRRDKQLLMAGLLTAPLPEEATASLYYRVNGGSWKLIRTYSEEDGLGFEAGAADLAGDQTNIEDFDSYKELQFKVVSTGGAEITGIVWTWKLIGADISTQ